VSGAVHKSPTSVFPGFAVKKAGGQSVCAELKDIKQKSDTIKYFWILFIIYTPYF
jgi:hypothetical protein